MIKNTATSNSVKNIKIAFWLNVVFTIIEIIGGLYTNSIAILADALHDLDDAVSLGLSWFLEKIAQKEKTSIFTYGYKRFSLLAALLNAIFLIIGSGFILIEVAKRLLHPEATSATGMMLLAIIGVAVNVTTALRIKTGHTLNEKIISLHLLEDAFGWMAIFIVSLVMMVINLPILDPILSMTITLYILWNVFKQLKATIMIFLQGVPATLSIEEINKALHTIPNTKGSHDTHLWSLDGETHIVTTHLVVDANTDYNKIKNIKNTAKVMTKKLGIQHSTIEIETENGNCDNKQENK